MNIGRSELVEVGDAVRIQAPIEYAGRVESLWYSVDKPYGLYLTTEKLDGFVVALLPLAMRLGEDIHVDGAVSEKLLYNLTHYYMKILTLVRPSAHRVNILPERLDSGTTHPCDREVAAGFSGGIDSLCAVIGHLNGVPPAYRITHLLFANVGSHGRLSEPAAARQLFLDRYERIKGLAAETDLTLIKMDSNLSDVLGMPFEPAHTIRTMSAAMQLQKRFAKYYYASSYRYQDCFVGEARGIAHVDPAAIHLLSTETLDCISTGCQYSRIEKTAKVAQWEPATRYLNVCTRTDSGGGNCSRCHKCLRTMLTLEMLGQLERFDGVFDLRQYRRHRIAHMTRVLRRKQAVFERELVEHAKRVGFRFPLRCRLDALRRRLQPW